ncbi:hypothetical protein GWK47_012724 [Chionoecetes opilio]|uniref:Uncharacterized protein n=1 Tax=Chionoecetes opilio TaxID=41210 RepID=A0A8J4Y583_CHIOP|nr:hypothetical protein GWK47_012724 [Chionoecetes opilio]
MGFRGPIAGVSTGQLWGDPGAPVAKEGTDKNRKDGFPGGEEWVPGTILGPFPSIRRPQTAAFSQAPCTREKSPRVAPLLGLACRGTTSGVALKQSLKRRGPSTGPGIPLQALPVTLGPLIVLPPIQRGPCQVGPVRQPLLHKPGQGLIPEYLQNSGSSCRPQQISSKESPEVPGPLFPPLWVLSRPDRAGVSSKQSGWGEKRMLEKPPGKACVQENEEARGKGLSDQHPPWWVRHHRTSAVRLTKNRVRVKGVNDSGACVPSSSSSPAVKRGGPVPPRVVKPNAARVPKTDQAGPLSLLPLILSRGLRGIRGPSGFIDEGRKNRVPGSEGGQAALGNGKVGPAPTSCRQHTPPGSQRTQGPPLGLLPLSAKGSHAEEMWKYRGGRYGGGGGSALPHSASWSSSSR